jgi:hypothetical protein
VDDHGEADPRRIAVSLEVPKLGGKERVQGAKEDAGSVWISSMPVHLQCRARVDRRLRQARRRASA